MIYDLLVKGGTVIDPMQDLHEKVDIGISEGKIRTVASNIPPTEAKKVVNVENKIVTPGLIDLHCHVFDAVVKWNVHPDIAGVRQGVTTIVDTGSAGEADFAAFPKYIIPSSRTRVFCFLNLNSLGTLCELRDWDGVKLEAMVTTIESHRDLIKGVNLLLLGNLVASAGVEVIRTAKKVAKKFGLPIMLHTGDMKHKGTRIPRLRYVSPALIQEVLPLMEPGDILSHVFTAEPGGCLRPDGTVLPELKEAMKRGVVLDTALGRHHFSFDVAQKSMAQGILPTVLSSDLSQACLNGPTYGLPVTMAKFMALGLDLKQVIEMTTINPARVIGVADCIGGLRPGMEADVSILQLMSGSWKLEDGQGDTLKATTMLVPSMTVKSGQLIPAQPVAQPQSLG